MSSTESGSKQEEDARIKAFEQEYKSSHPDGPFPGVELKPKQKSK